MLIIFCGYYLRALRLRVLRLRDERFLRLPPAAGAAGRGAPFAAAFTALIALALAAFTAFTAFAFAAITAFTADAFAALTAFSEAAGVIGVFFDKSFDASAPIF